VELALALANEDYDTSLVSSVGNDMDGWNIIANLIQGNVDVQHIVVDNDKQTNESIIIVEGKRGSRTFVGVGPTTSLSITSPSQVPWNELETSKVVYIGEVFVEVAAAIAAHTKVQNTPTVYRCSVPYWELGLDRLKPVLSLVDTLIISNRAWLYLKQKFGSITLKKLREITDAAIIVHQSKNKYQLNLVGKKYLTFSYVSDSADISEVFVTRLMTKLAEGVDTFQAVEYALAHEG
jgi:sugar/nucleoside kinase (ribokinase family)